MHNTIVFWLRWSWRDLKDHWLQVTVIASIIALGTAVYAGLGSTTPWRQQSAEASYDLLNMYDVRVQFPAETYVDQDQVLRAITSIEHAAWVESVEPRLITNQFVRVPTIDGDILVRGKLHGLQFEDGGPYVNSVHISSGQSLTGADDNAALLEYHFAEYYSLPPEGQVILGSGVTLPYVGHAMVPEYFMVTTEEGGIWAQANFAAVFVPLDTAQAITERPNLINDVVLTLTDDADRARVEREIAAALDEALPGTSASLTRREDDVIHRLMFETIRMNQQVYDLMIVLFLTGASFGAFNLATRIVEAQRRQIGIGMALGIRRRLLVLRPLLIGAQIAVLGAILGLGLGLAVGKLAELWMRDLIPLPIMSRLFDTRTFLEAAALGLVLPFAATLYPVWRAVRVLPVDAIQTGHLIENSKGSGLAALLVHIPLPGKSFVQMPLRNLLRSPRRTLLTILGVTVAITTLVGLVGIRDSALVSLARIRDEYYQDHPERLTVYLNSFYPSNAAQIAALVNAPEMIAAQPAIRVPGWALRGNTRFNVLIEVLPLDGHLWAPTVTEGQRPTPGDIPGVLIAKNAALDLDINLGDTVTLEHPQRTGLLSYRIVTTEVQVTGYHADEWRTFVYMDTDQAALLGLEGMTNIIDVLPQPDLDQRAAKNALFDYEGVASVIAVNEAIESSEGLLNEAMRFLSGVQIAVLVLAFLIAFNSTNINMHERAREIATQFAFGLPPRTVARMAMLENLITSIVGTLLGFILGGGVLAWMLTVKMPEITPEIRFPFTLTPLTLVTAVVIGVLVTTLTPLLFIRRMSAMDIPATLRVME